MGIRMSVEFYRESPGKFDSRTLNRKTLDRWTGRTTNDNTCLTLDVLFVEIIVGEIVLYYIYIYIYTHTIYICVCMSVCMCIHIYIYIYIYTQLNNNHDNDNSRRRKGATIRAPDSYSALRIRPIFLLILPLLTSHDSNFPGNILWAWEFHPFKLRSCFTQTLWNPQG